MTFGSKYVQSLSLCKSRIRIIVPLDHIYTNPLESINHPLPTIDFNKECVGNPKEQGEKSFGELTNKVPIIEWKNKGFNKPSQFSHAKKKTN